MRRLGLVSLCALLLAGCGYSSRRLTAFPDARTIAVVPFQNATYRRDLGVRLTRAVVDEVRTRTAYHIGAPESADIVLTGLFDANESVQGLDQDRVPIIQRLSGTLRVTITERSTNKVLKTQSFFAQAEFLPSDRGETLDARGTDEWTRRMAVQVVQMLEAPM